MRKRAIRAAEGAVIGGVATIVWWWVGAPDVPELIRVVVSGALAGAIVAIAIARAMGDRSVPGAAGCLIALVGAVIIPVVAAWAAASGHLWPIPDWAVGVAWGAISGGLPVALYAPLIHHVRESPELRKQAIVGATVVLLLAVLLYPTLRMPGTITKARQPACVHNLRQLSAAMDVYLSDYDGVYPPSASSAESLGVNPRNSEWPEAVEGYLLPYGGDPWLWICPEQAKWKRRPARPRRSGDPGSVMHYGWNAALAGQRQADLGRADEIPAMFDRDPLHNGGRAIAFANGQVKWLTETDFQELEVDAR